MTSMSPSAFEPAKRAYWILGAIVLAGFALRLHVVLGSTYHWDEEREWIPFAQSISLEPGNVNLPIRAISHPILPAYIIKLGSLVAGENPLGFRLMSLLAGTATIAVLALVALRWRGFWVAFWAASLLAFNEYHIFVSSLAIDKPFQLLFAALAMAGFIRFLQTENSRALYFAGVMTGVAFLCKETTGLLLPGFLLALLLSQRHRGWLLRGAPYIAVLLFVAVISPDLFLNFFMRDELDYSYSDHLGRAAGIGFTRHHLLFFLRDAISWVYGLMGQQLSDLAPEYASMNSLLGAILLGVAAWSALRLCLRPDARQDGVSLYLPIAFWTIFGFFLLIDVSSEGAIQHLAYVAWFWSDLVLMPACLMAGAFLVSLTGHWRVAGQVAAAAGLAYAFLVAAMTRVGTPEGPMVAFNPEYMLPPNGRHVNVEATFNYCMVCEKDMTVELLDVKLHEPDGTTTSVLGTGLARVQPGSPDGTKLVLQARDADPASKPVEPWQEVMWYEISYALTDEDGRRHHVEDRVFSPLHPSEFGPRFWSGEPRESGG